MSAVQDKATEVLLNLITKAANGLDAAVTFSKEQIPDVVGQLLMWNLVSSLLLWILSLFLIIVPFIVLSWMCKQLRNKVKWAYSECNDRSTDEFDFTVYLVTIIGAVSVFIGGVILFNSYDWLKILIAPKLYLLEYAASLIKS